MPSVLKVALAVVLFLLIWRAGFAILRGLARPIDPPPEAGALRKVNLRYRCMVCSTEVRMTLANDALPDPPRHCQEEMALVAPVE